MTLAKRDRVKLTREAAAEQINRRRRRGLDWAKRRGIVVDFTAKQEAFVLWDGLGAMFKVPIAELEKESADVPVHVAVISMKQRRKDVGRSMKRAKDDDA